MGYPNWEVRVGDVNRTNNWRKSANHRRFMRGKKGYILGGCASTHFILLKLLLRTFWAGKYTHCAGLRKSVCHELTHCSGAGLSMAEREDDH